MKTTTRKTGSNKSTPRHTRHSTTDEDRARLDRLYFLASRGGLVCPEGVEPLDAPEHDEEFLELHGECVERGFNLPTDDLACDCKMCLEMLKERVWEQFRRLKVH